MTVINNRIFLQIAIGIISLLLIASSYGDEIYDIHLDCRIPDHLLARRNDFFPNHKYEYELPAQENTIYGVKIKGMKANGHNFLIDYTSEEGTQEQYEQQKSDLWLFPEKQQLLDNMLQAVPTVAADVLCADGQRILVLGDQNNNYHECSANGGLKLTQKTPFCLSQHENSEQRTLENDIVRQLQFIYTITIKHNTTQKLSMTENQAAKHTTASQQLGGSCSQ